MEIKNKKIDRKFLGGWVLNRVRPVWRWRENVFVWRWGGRRWWAHVKHEENYFCLQEEGRDVVNVSGGVCWRLKLSSRTIEEGGLNVFTEWFEHEVRFLQKVFEEFGKVNESSGILADEIERELEDLRERLGVALFGYRLGSGSGCFCKFPDFIGTSLSGWSYEFVYDDGYYFLFRDLDGCRKMCDVLAKFMLDLSGICYEVVKSEKSWGVWWKLGEREYALVCDAYSACLVEFPERGFYRVVLGVSHGKVSSRGGLLSDSAYVDSSLIPVREYWRKLKEVLNSLAEFLDGGE